ncbi:hypothetical protein J6590_005898 [Homalodisca vitripennis]|nr:hypothetical protein J6590_005898 [Homalodisca vitripennis]
MSMTDGAQPESQPGRQPKTITRRTIALPRRKSATDKSKKRYGRKEPEEGHQHVSGHLRPPSLGPSLYGNFQNQY